MPTAVISGRVDNAIRLRAEIAMRKAGLTPSDIIQNVWAFMATTGEVPDAAKSTAETEGKQEALSRLNKYLDSLPPANPAYEGWSDDDILTLKVSDYV